MGKYLAFGYRSKKSKLKPTIIVILLLIFLVVGGVILWRYKQTKTNITSKTNTSQNNNIPYQVDGKYLFSGTIVLSRDVARYAGSNYNQPFSQMYTLGKYDAHIGVLECPITNNYDSFENEVQNLVFNCQPAWVPTLKKYFPILDLSSDHLNDEGPQGIAETFATLQQAGIQTVGTYNPASLSDDCKAIILPVRLIDKSDKVTSASLPIAICSYNYKELFSPQPGQLQSIQKWSRLMPVIALFNHGLEYQLTANSQTVAIAHQMIDYGADFVIGNGTHWVQNTEVYKGKLIVYSMGNFIFDQIQYNGRIALNLSVAMTIKYNRNVERWISLSPICLKQPENCLEYAQKEKLSKIKPSYTFSAVGSYGGDARVATLANAQQQAAIDSIANWQSTERLLTKSTN
jgi:poly-gamma-glutamate synthesis protein (capsule biosynthesis protein)